MLRRHERADEPAGEPPRAYVYVHEIPAFLECSVCLEVFQDPVTLPCGHTFCRGCATTWFAKNTSKRCPKRCTLSATFKPAVLQVTYGLRDAVDKLLVYCKHGLREDATPDPDGCPAQVKRELIATHEKACPYAFETCPYAGCGAKRRRRDADAHDDAAAKAHAHGEREARLALEPRLAHANAQLAAALQARVGAQSATLYDGPGVSPGSVPSGIRSAPVAALVCHTTLEGRSALVYACAWNLSGTLLASASGDSRQGTLQVWDVAAGTRITRECHPHNTFACSFSPDGSKVACGGDDKLVKVLSVHTGEWKELDCGNSRVCVCAWNPAGDTLLSAGRSGVLKLWNVDQGTCTTTLTGHTSIVFGGAWSPDGSTVLSCSGDCTMKLWDVVMRSCVATLSVKGMKQVSACAFSPSGGMVLSASGDGALRLWSAAAPFNCIRKLNGRHDRGVNAAAWSPDGGSIASCGEDKKLLVWNAVTGDPVVTIIGADTDHDMRVEPRWTHASNWRQQRHAEAVGRTIAAQPLRCTRVQHDAWTTCVQANTAPPLLSLLSRPCVLR